MEASRVGPAVVTLAERKRAEAERRLRAGDAIAEALAAYARREGGCFVLYGSYVSGMMRYDSDFDVLVDFPPSRSGDAWDFVETVCAEHGIAPDLHDAATSRDAFVDRVRAQGRILP